MIRVVGIRFKKAGKIYYFSPKDFDIKKDDHVIVETARGIEYGICVVGIKEIPEEQLVSPLKDVLRVATEEDRKKHEENKKREADAIKICEEKVEKHGLNMKLIDVEYTFDNNKVIFYFTAEGRVDFRELVKDLASIFKTRIELRQIGVRDEAKMIGGLGPCGRPLCCSTFLGEFAPVSIKMAKEQSLSLNPSKISGICGRLMCCLTYEEEAYKSVREKMPCVGSIVSTDQYGKGEVVDCNLLKELVKVKVRIKDEEDIKLIALEDVKLIKGAYMVDENDDVIKLELDDADDSLLVGDILKEEKTKVKVKEIIKE
ncbi:Cell fate regulator YaaT, PSP1 superfamily (controls sporulation, competence, biofilm development) [Hathewaya proteolytica DSM 3090]|uniref:Cell fate regulator YaaT, PSP1 superfamily (Controls sporulation, competence, biofilm development) n=1 Tax=Hathewaya proteolytica DSM 3090 TaxID=1121331 RepID=A0A1M6T3Q9_9CLOT|nr:stage 0 sporulation family protein [Hathewaya proteolytica]SHK51571.1 Cell fate regulator YaaT, PSP1 superfamily (controls sporulation, competence, biofilm development) [Hathewaya proteolytica DSM 3090]